MRDRPRVKADGASPHGLPPSTWFAERARQFVDRGVRTRVPDGAAALCTWVVLAREKRAEAPASCLQGSASAFLITVFVGGDDDVCCGKERRPANHERVAENSAVD